MNGESAWGAFPSIFEGAFPGNGQMSEAVRRISRALDQADEGIELR